MTVVEGRGPVPARTSAGGETAKCTGVAWSRVGLARRVERHDGVERLHVAHAVAGRPLYWTSVYRTGDVLVDTGCRRGRDAFRAFLAERPVAAALTTHEHEDHVGNHECLPPGVDVVAPRRAADLLDRGPPALPPYRWLTWGAHGPAPGARVPGDRVQAAGRRFLVVPTPGHSADHVAYLDEDAAALYSGDAWFGMLRAVRAKEDVPEQVRSIRRLADLDPAVVYPTHGAILERPRARFLETADRFDRLAERARALRERGLSPRRIRQELLGPEPALTYASFGAFSAENLVKGLLAQTRTR